MMICFITISPSMPLWHKELIFYLYFLGTALSGQRGNKLQLKLRFDIDTDSNLHFATFIRHRKLASHTFVQVLYV